MLRQVGTASAKVLVAAALVAAGALLAAPSDPVAIESAAQPLTVPTFPSGDGGSPTAPAHRVGPEWHVLDWAPGPLAGVTQAAGYDTVVDGRTVKKIFVSTGANPDVGTAETVSNMSVSLDSGLSFLTTKRDRPEMALNLTRLPDGSLIAIDFVPAWSDDAHTSVNLIVRHSTDAGETWQVRNGLFTPPAGQEFGGMDRGLRVWRRPMVLPDNTIIVPAYTVYKGGRGMSVLLQSNNGGRTWTQRSEIPASLATNEVALSYTTDGRLLAVLRTGEAAPRLVTASSTDDGRTWTTAVPLLGPGGAQVVGIDPDLVLQPNGILLLATGRPDARVLIDNDGTGRTWDVEEVVYANAPSTTGNGRYDGNSGNNSMVNVGADRTVFFGDKCHIWGCGAYDNQFGVFAKYLSVVTPGTGKLDIGTQVAQGSGTVTGQFAKPDTTFPETRPAGAFDGSSAPNSSAVLHTRQGIEPTMVIKLDRPYQLNRVGMMLGSGKPLSATVSLSTDGKKWSTPVVTAQKVRDRAMRYTDFTAQEARYIKITAPAGSLTPITEFEAYSAEVQTFENDPIFGVPRGFSDAKHAWTTDVPATPGTTTLGGFHSRTALRLWDKWLDDNATATRLAPDAARQTVTFDWGVTDHRGPFVFGVKGHAGQNTTTPWQFRIVDTKPLQTVEAFDGTQWTAMGTLTTRVELFRWAPIAVDTTLDSATVTVNGQAFTTTKRAEAADTLAGVTFSTGDPAAYGLTFFIDNLSVSGSQKISDGDVENP
jgi:hypothetical protein